jgi:hypothetical protein
VNEIREIEPSEPVVDAYLRLNMLEIASNSRDPTTHTNGVTTAKPNNQVAIGEVYA